MRVWSVPAGDTLHRCLEIPEAVLLHGRDELRAVAGEARGLLHHDAAARPAHRVAQRVGIEWRHGAHVDDLRIDSGGTHGGFGDVHHGAVGNDGEVVTLAHHLGAADRHRVVTVRDFTARMRAPGDRRLVGVTVEGSVVDAL